MLSFSLFRITSIENTAVLFIDGIIVGCAVAIVFEPRHTMLNSNTAVLNTISARRSGRNAAFLQSRQLTKIQRRKDTLLSTRADLPLVAFLIMLRCQIVARSAIFNCKLSFDMMLGLKA